MKKLIMVVTAIIIVASVNIAISDDGKKRRIISGQITELCEASEPKKERLVLLKVPKGKTFILTDFRSKWDTRCASATQIRLVDGKGPAKYHFHSKIGYDDYYSNVYEELNLSLISGIPFENEVVLEFYNNHITPIKPCEWVSFWDVYVIVFWSGYYE